MIEFLRLRNLGVIADAEFELGPGLTVLTGETGAGKTMVLSALNLLLGGKMQAGLATEKDTAVQGEWRVDEDSSFHQQLVEAGVDVSEGELLLTRTLPAKGRSRCSANGLVVPQTVLAQWADDMVAVHGQSEQVLLRRPARQRDVLDRFAGAKHDKLRQRYAQQFEKVRTLNEQWRIATESRDELDRELTRLTESLVAIDKVNPVAGEDDTLADRALRLSNLSALQSAAAVALEAINGDEDSGSGGASAGVHAARRSLESALTLDGDLTGIAEQLAAAAAVLNEVAVDLSRYLADLDAQPDELEQIQSRRADLSALTRQFGPNVEDVLKWAADARSRVDELTQASDLAGLKANRDQARADLGGLAAQLSESREAAARKFVQAVSEELRGLAMPHSSLEITIKSHPMADGPGALPLPNGDFVAFGPSGVDEVEFLLRPHDGATAAPIAQAASGGELSRIMLALEVVLSDSATAPTMVFDEVDAGVGGKAAVEIGRRLQMLSRNTQVLVVTHLPQVAAFADRHLMVSKSFDGTVTTSDVASLDGEGRVKELARMLAGQEHSEHAAAHAEELLALGAAGR